MTQGVVQFSEAVRVPDSNHSACLQEGQTAVQQQSEQRAEEALTATIPGDPFQGTCRLRQVTNTGDWLTIQPSTVNGTELGSQ